MAAHQTTFGLEQFLQQKKLRLQSVETDGLVKKKTDINSLAWLFYDTVLFFKHHNSFKPLFFYSFCEVHYVL